jgi:ABC-type transporter Mla MlaB component
MSRSARRPFSWERKGDHLVLAGSIDESAKLSELVAHAVNGSLVLDLAGITFINSIGVREWLRLQQAATDAGVVLELRHVAEVLIHQLNIVPAARGASVVTSFYASYLCEHCDDQLPMLLDVKAHGVELAQMRPPAMICPTCKKAMTFCDPAELYFSFLSGTSPLR